MRNYDVNVLHAVASTHHIGGEYKEALRVFFFIVDGDATLEADYYAERIGRCYEMLGDLAAAKYWYGRAVEENPAIAPYVMTRQRLE